MRLCVVLSCQCPVMQCQPCAAALSCAFDSQEGEKEKRRKEQEKRQERERKYHAVLLCVNSEQRYINPSFPLASSRRLWVRRWGSEGDSPGGSKGGLRRVCKWHMHQSWRAAGADR